MSTALTWVLRLVHDMRESDVADKNDPVQHGNREDADEQALAAGETSSGSVGEPDAAYRHEVDRGGAGVERDAGRSSGRGS